MSDPLLQTAHRPYPLPHRPWRMRQRWNNLLFAHWPVPPAAVARTLPDGLEVDTFNGTAWLGVVPFFMDQVRVRTIGEHTLSVPTTRAFPELNLRTYVRSRRTGRRGVWFYSLDAGSPLAVFGARTLFSLPYFPARMTCRPDPDGSIVYTSRRRVPRSRPAETRLCYRPTAPIALSQPGDLASFLTERYCLFTISSWTHRLLVGEIHHQPWPLQPAEAEWHANDLPADFGFSLPTSSPVLHFARALDVVIWLLKPDA